MHRSHRGFPGLLHDSEHPLPLPCVSTNALSSYQRTEILLHSILVDVLRTGSLASKVWFECAWLAAAALFNLGMFLASPLLYRDLTPPTVAAAASTGTLTKCSATDPKCSAGAHVLLPITWVATLVGRSRSLPYPRSSSPHLRFFSQL